MCGEKIAQSLYLSGAILETSKDCWVRASMNSEVGYVSGSSFLSSTFWVCEVFDLMDFYKSIKQTITSR